MVFKKGNTHRFKKGHVMSSEIREKISDTMKGKNTWSKGKKASRATKEKMSIMRKGNKHWNWQGGIAKRCTCTTEYKEWRTDVFKRDNWTCQECGTKGYVEAHHIKTWKRFPELRLDTNNGQTLCQPCHNLTKQGAGT